MADEILRSKHGFGNLADVLNALKDGKIDAYDILFLDGDTEPKIGWIDKNNNFRLVESKCVTVVEGESLPESGVSGKVYIFKDEGYFWNGKEFVNFCKPTDLTALENRLTGLEKNLNQLSTVIVDLEAEVEKKANSEDVQKDIEQAKLGAIEAAKSYADEKSEDVLNSTKHLYEKNKYEIANVPVGTLVDYRENEIRIMCPKDTVFKKQSVGAGGNPNSYYMTFNTYFPNENIVGYIEHLDEQVDAEILTKSSTDKYGRKYQSTWLAIADYDETSESWTYRGSESTKDGYYGYNYQIDWYNADGVMIASDSVRINLSNEECHFTSEPYYMTKIVKEIDTKIDTKIEEKIEEKIAEVESAYEVIEF